MSKDNFLKKVKQTGYHTDHGLTQISFVIDQLSSNQIACIMTDTVNSWLDNNFGIDPIAFYIDNSFPSIPLKFPRYHACDLVGYQGNIIATSLSTILAAKNSFQGHKFFYIQDLEWERGWCKYNKDQTNEILNDTNIVKFCRSADHRDYITKSGYKVLDKIVEDFNIADILEIINDNRNTK